jgi:hypothetical protein
MLSDIEIYLPKYLSADEQTQLFEELRQFPENIDGRMYSSICDYGEELYQGDGLSNLPIVSLPLTNPETANVMIISNTCDISPDNERFYPAFALYCPLIRLTAYEELLHQTFPQSADRIQSHINSIRRQECSPMFFLPKGAHLPEDFIALMDHIVHHKLQALDLSTLIRGRLFTLSDYGYYLFLFKLSIHFTRMRDGVIRGYSN